MSEIFGRRSENVGSSSSTSSSNSYNRAYPTLLNQYQGTMNTGTGATNQLAGMLGLNGAQGQSDAFKNWQNSTGYQFGLNQGLQSINGNAAATGLLNSGATAKALQTYGQNYANTQYGNYTNQLQGLVNSGLQAGGLVGGTGNVSQSQSQSQSNQVGRGPSGGIAGAVGQLLSKG